MNILPVLGQRVYKSMIIKPRWSTQPAWIFCFRSMSIAVIQRVFQQTGQVGNTTFVSDPWPDRERQSLGTNPVPLFNLSKQKWSYKVATKSKRIVGIKVGERKVD